MFQPAGGVLRGARALFARGLFAQHLGHFGIDAPPHGGRGLGGGILRCVCFVGVVRVCVLRASVLRTCVLRVVRVAVGAGVRLNLGLDVGRGRTGRAALGGGHVFPGVGGLQVRLILAGGCGVIGMGLKPGIATVGTLHIAPGLRDHILRNLVLRAAIRASQPHLNTCRLPGFSGSTCHN